MKEVGIDLSKAHSKSVERFTDQQFDYVITVCDSAKETCPVFTGEVRHRLHFDFDDPAEAVGTEEEVLSTFRRVRNEIREEFSKLYNNLLTQNDHSRSL